MQKQKWVWGNPVRFGLGGLFLFSLIDVKTASAAATNSFFSLDVGPYMTQVDRRLDAQSGYGSKMSTFAGFIRARKGIPVSTSWNWEPSLGILVPWRSGADGFAKTFMVQASMPFGYSPLTWMHFRVGPGLLWRLMLTNAEGVTLNNGTGTSTFYLPGGAHSIFQFTVDAGIEFRFFQSVSLGMDVWVTEVANKSRRSFNAAVTLGFYL